MALSLFPKCTLCRKSPLLQNYSFESAKKLRKEVKS
jgi:hypothetical protein